MKQSTKRKCILLYLFCIALFMISARCSFAAVSVERARAIFLKLENVSNVHVVLRIDPLNKVNAYSNVGVVVVYKGLLNFCDNEDQLAWVLGHELAHIRRGDIFHSEAAYRELAADVLGAQYAMASGYPSGISFLYKMRRIYGDQGKDGVHPTWTKRINNILNGSLN